MPRGRDRTLQDVETYLRKRLRRKLRNDLRNLRIVKEADVECAAYFHIRRYIGEDPDWRVLARKHVRVTGHYIDLLIFKGDFPAIAVELKWGQRRIGRKDTRSLTAALRKLGVNKAYWLSALSSTEPREPVVKQEHDKYVFHRILVTPGLSARKLEGWKKRRDVFKGQMKTGKGRRRVK